MSVPDLAKAAGMATGSVYRHFESKAHLVNVLLREQYAALLTELTRAVTRGGVRAAFAAVMALAESSPDAFDVLFLQQHGDYADSETVAFQRQLDGVLAEAIAGHWEEPLVGDTTSQAVAAALFWSACGATVRGLRSGAFSGLAEPAEVALSLLLGGLDRRP